MTDTKRNQYSRREFLQLSWTIGAGLTLPAVLYGCSLRRVTVLVRFPEETFVEPTDVDVGQRQAGRNADARVSEDYA